MLKPEAFGVVWFDPFFGLWLTLSKPNAAEAVEAAKRIRANGKVTNVRAVHVPKDSDTMHTIDEAPR